MIEELPSRALAYRFTHELVRRALYDRLTGRAAGRAAPARRRGARARRGALGPRARRPRAPLRRRRAARRRRSAASSTTSSPRGRRPPRSPSTRRRRGCAPRSSCGSTSPRRARGGATSSSAPPATAPARRSTRWRRSGRRRRSPASWATRELLARAAIGYEDACWRPGIADQGAVELLEEAAAALGDESSELRVGLLGGLARALDFQGDHERGAIVRTNAVAMARRLRRPRPAWPRCWCAPTGRAGTSSLEEILDDAHRGQGPRRGARQHRDPRRGDGLARARPSSRSCDIESARREVGRAAARPPSRRRSRSCSTSPSTTARRSRCATGASTRPRRGRSARTSGAGC